MIQQAIEAELLPSYVNVTTLDGKQIIVSDDYFPGHQEPLTSGMVAQWSCMEFSGFALEGGLFQPEVPILVLPEQPDTLRITSVVPMSATVSKRPNHFQPKLRHHPGDARTTIGNRKIDENF